MTLMPTADSPIRTARGEHLFSYILCNTLPISKSRDICFLQLPYYANDKSDMNTLLTFSIGPSHVEASPSNPCYNQLMQSLLISGGVDPVQLESWMVVIGVFMGPRIPTSATLSSSSSPSPS